jgi:hypothetical protein
MCQILIFSELGTGIYLLVALLVFPLVSVPIVLPDLAPDLVHALLCILTPFQLLTRPVHYLLEGLCTSCETGVGVRKSLLPSIKPLLEDVDKLLESELPIDIGGKRGVHGPCCCASSAGEDALEAFIDLFWWLSSEGLLLKLVQTKLEGVVRQVTPGQDVLVPGIDQNRLDDAQFVMQLAEEVRELDKRLCVPYLMTC